MIENFTLDTDANPENMNMLIEGINKNEEDITAVKKSVEGVSSQIGQIANDRGYLTTKRFTEASDLNNLLLNGFYESNLFLNTPYGLGGWFNVHVKNLNGGYCHQILTGMEGVAIGRVFERNRNNNVWSPWKEIATTDKVITTSPWEIPQKIDANNIRTTGIIVTSSYCTNVPGITGGYASTEGFLYTRKFNDAYIVQEFRSIYNNEPKWNRFLFFNNWTPWTAGKQEIPFPFNAGFIQSDVGYACKIVKSDIKQGVIYCGVRKSDGSDFIAHAENAIGTLPTSFLSSFFSMVGAIPSNNINGAGMLGTARAIIFGQQVYVLTTVNCKAIFFTIPYEIGG